MSIQLPGIDPDTAGSQVQQPGRILGVMDQHWHQCHKGMIGPARQGHQLHRFEPVYPDGLAPGDFEGPVRAGHLNPACPIGQGGVKVGMEGVRAQKRLARCGFGGSGFYLVHHLVQNWPGVGGAHGRLAWEGRPGQGSQSRRQP